MPYSPCAGAPEGAAGSLAGKVLAQVHCDWPAHDTLFTQLRSRPRGRSSRPQGHDNTAMCKTCVGVGHMQHIGHYLSS